MFVQYLVRHARLILALVVLLLCGQCAKPHPQPLPIQRYVFVETLPPETQVCVRTNPWLDSLSCLSLGEVRTLLRGIRKADAFPAE